ncbi:hypothetical protein U1Q18_048211, partial [Sarracenia purpurea var. burkii]
MIRRPKAPIANKPIYHRPETVQVVFVERSFRNPVKELQSRLAALVGIDNLRDVVRFEIGTQTMEFGAFLPMNVTEDATDLRDQIREAFTGG